MHRRSLVGALIALALASGGPTRAAEAPEFTRTRDVIYGRKYGLALTLDVFTPKKPNGLAVISVVSGGWRSSPANISPVLYHEMLRRGYTVFAVVHGSTPRFTILDAVDDLNRAVRFIRSNSKRFAIDPDRLGIMGASAGGHLALMQGTAGDKGDPKASDPIDRLSSKVQCVGCFFPPTDFLNFGKKGNELVERALKPPFTAAVDYHEYDRKKALFVPITDPKKLREIARKVSPAWHVNVTSAPALIIHGDRDELVPLQQSELMVERLKEAGVPAKLVVRKGEGHGWLTLVNDLTLLGDWFDQHLARKEKNAE